MKNIGLFESPMPRKMELMMLYAVINGIPIKHCTSGHNRGAHSQPYDHDGKHVHDLTADRDSGGAVYRVKLSDDEQICGAVQGL